MSGRGFGPLRSGDFRKLVAGQFVSVIGDKLNQIAMAIMVFKLTGSSLQMGVMLSVTWLPAALFGIFAGAFVDRWNRRVTMICCDLTRAALVLTIPFLLRWGPYPAYVVAFVVATVSLFFEPAKLSLLPDLVRPDELLGANSLDNTAYHIAELGGLAFAGGVVAGVGYERAFMLDGLSYVISAVLIALIAFRELPRPAEARRRLQDVFGEVAYGVRFILERPTLREVIALSGVAFMGAAASITVFFQLALQQYELGALGLALLDAAITVGMLLGTVTLARSGHDLLGRKVAGALLLFGLAWTALALGPGVYVVGALLLLTGVANMWFYVPMVTLVQRHSDESVRGRVMGGRTAIVRTLNVVGLIGAGLGLEHLGMVPMILLVGAVMVLAGLWAAMRPAIAQA